MGLPENVATNSLTAVSFFSLIRVRCCVRSCSEATTSARRELPDRSPMPLTLVWSPRAPASTAARQFAVASP